MSRDLKTFKNNVDWFSYQGPDALSGGQERAAEKRRLRRLQWLFILLLIFGYVAFTMAQNSMDNTFNVPSDFEPTIKDAVKFTDQPEIKDSVKRISSAPYGIQSNPLFPKYQVEPINPAKMQNEPLSKLYHSLIKAGYGPVYNMPYGEAWFSSTRSREMLYGVHYKYLSSTAHLQDYGYSGFSDNEAEVYAKKFYKKHTLSGEFNYKRNLVHFYGYDTTINKITDKNFAKQRFQLFEPKVRLQSHYTDSSMINHDIQLAYYNLQDLYYSAENNVKLNADLSTFINKEKLHVNVLADYYNHKRPKDTINDFIGSINPYFEANGKKWHADLGLTATIDAFNKTTKFYFYPQLNVFFDVYESMIIPYAGVSGGLMKNSFRSLSTENPFINPQVNYANTNNKYNVYGGLRGNLSSNTSYDAYVNYGQYDSLHYFVINYSDPTLLHNQFNVVYDNTSLLKVGGQLKYQYKEKMHLIAKGNYYLYKPQTFLKAYHKPNYDITLSGIYNLKSKIILKADIFTIGNQWALTQTENNGVFSYQPKLLNYIVDVNVGVEYRYSKMLGFFVSFNNIANMRYYRWENYPTQRFNMMLGLTFVPF
ncbi:MAG: hypothetical protein ACXVP0_11700 [Bacteroidia bacterium]